MNFRLDLDPDCLMPLILNAFPLKSLLAPLFRDKMHYPPKNDFILTKPIFCA